MHISQIIKSLYECGAIQLSVPPTFILKPKNSAEPGTLSPELVTAMADDMLRIAKDHRLDYRYVTGLPGAEAFAQAFAAIANRPGIPVTLVDFDSNPPEVRGKLLVIHSLVAKGSSHEEHLAALVGRGWEVTDVQVFLDTLQGGVEMLARSGYRVHSVISSSLVFSTLHDLGIISKETYGECMRSTRQEGAPFPEPVEW